MLNGPAIEAVSFRGSGCFPLISGSLCSRISMNVPLPFLGSQVEIVRNRSASHGSIWRNAELIQIFIHRFHFGTSTPAPWYLTSVEVIYHSFFRCGVGERKCLVNILQVLPIGFDSIVYLGPMFQDFYRLVIIKLLVQSQNSLDIMCFEKQKSLSGHYCGSFIILFCLKSSIT